MALKINEKGGSITESARGGGSVGKPAAILNWAWKCSGYSVIPAGLPAKPNDLAGFKAVLNGRTVSHAALSHFDLAAPRKYYDVDLFAALRFLIMEDGRKLTLLVQSRTAFGALLPKNHPLFEIDIKTVELRGKP